MNDGLPEGWTICQVQECFRSFSGGTPDKGTPAYWGGNIPWLSSGDIKANRIHKASESITKAGLENSSAKLCRPGSVLVVVRSGILKHTLPVAVLDCEASINQDIKCFDSGDDELNEWFALALQAAAKNILALNREGTTVQSVKYETLKEFELRALPQNEQRRIVAKIGVLLAKVNACQQRLRVIPAILKRFRQAVLAAACTGRLTADWRTKNPDIEPAATVIGRLKRAEGGVGVRRGVPKFVPPSDVVAEWEMPDTWGSLSAAELLRCGAIVDLKDGNHGANHPKASEFTEDGLPFITAAQVNNFRIDYASAYKLSGESLARIRIGFARPGDVIYTHKGSVGRVAVADRECVLTPQTTYYRLSPEVFNSEFLMYYLASAFFSGQVNVVKEQTTRDFVPISEQYLLFHRVPPLPEQEEIVRRTRALFMLADRIEARYDKAKAQVDKLTQSVLARAFRGELVSTEAELARHEGRPYETAEALLARIRQGRVETPGKSDHDVLRRTSRK